MMTSQKAFPSRQRLACAYKAKARKTGTSFIKDVRLRNMRVNYYILKKQRSLLKLNYYASKSGVYEIACQFYELVPLCLQA